MSEPTVTPAAPELLAESREGVATVTLNRPEVHNALSERMLRGLATLLDDWQDDPAIEAVHLRGAGSRAFCAGGDIRALHREMSADADGHHQFFQLEYSLDYRIHTYPKPVTAFIDGIVMGGGMGIAQGARRRIVGDRTRMAMPETIIGLFPDVGASWFLPRCPGRIGLYLGLLGPTINAADALYAGLADEYRSSQREQPEPGELEKLRPLVDRHFGGDSVLDIVRSLEAESSPDQREWARATAAALRARSPTLLCVTFEQLRRGATMALADCFRMELDLIHGCFDQGDIVEGIRARIVDKDNTPRWRPPTLEEVAPESVERFFRSRWAPDRHPLAHLGKEGRKSP
ncbi:MAG TPA: enoyl-CoA hydratase/isomerase family protein [Usitatibacter sp.]|nr:enoyl-CoA hydratase/isomerase family protein [Usitatibacter sp.]